MASDLHAPPPEPALPPWPFTIGLCGGIASGKSSVARILAEAGYVVLDADVEARAVLESADLRPWLVETFGDAVIGDDGSVQRKRIAERVFGDAELLAALEARIHPAVRRALRAGREQALAAGFSVVLDVPLLFESGYDEVCDLILYVDVDDETRRARAVARGMSEDDWRRREQTQLPVAEKRARAHRAIPNAEGLPATRAALSELLDYARGRA